MKKTMNALKTLASGTSSNEILDFLNEESLQQAAGDDALLKIMTVLVQKSHSVITSPAILPMSEPRNQFRYGMTNFRPNSSMMSHQRSMLQDLSGSQQEIGNLGYSADK